MLGGMPIVPIGPCIIGYMLMFNYHAMCNLMKIIGVQLSLPRDFKSYD
jgi:hypothetical protein